MLCGESSLSWYVQCGHLVMWKTVSQQSEESEVNLLHHSELCQARKAVQPIESLTDEDRPLIPKMPFQSLKPSGSLTVTPSTPTGTTCLCMPAWPLQGVKSFLKESSFKVLRWGVTKLGRYHTTHSMQGIVPYFGVSSLLSPPKPDFFYSFIIL